MKELLYKVIIQGEEKVVNGVVKYVDGRYLTLVNGTCLIYCENPRIYTGVKDSNDELIFEGDEVVLEYLNRPGRTYVKGIVTYIECGFHIDSGTELISLFTESDKLTLSRSFDEKDLIINELKNKIKELKSKLNVDEEIINFKHNEYKLVSRKAELGDVIVYPKIHDNWSSSILADVPYEVVNYKEEPLFDLDGSELYVYGISTGYDDLDSVKVYEKIN